MSNFELRTALAKASVEAQVYVVVGIALLEEHANDQGDTLEWS